MTVWKKKGNNICDKDVDSFLGILSTKLEKVLFPVMECGESQIMGIPKVSPDYAKFINDQLLKKKSVKEVDNFQNHLDEMAMFLERNQENITDLQTP